VPSDSTSPYRWAPIPSAVSCKVQHFTTFNLYGKWDVTDHLNLHGSITNLFDTKAQLDWATYGGAPGAVPWNPSLHLQGAIGALPGSRRSAARGEPSARASWLPRSRAGALFLALELHVGAGAMHARPPPRCGLPAAVCLAVVLTLISPPGGASGQALCDLLSTRHARCSGGRRGGARSFHRRRSTVLAGDA